MYIHAYYINTYIHTLSDLNSLKYTYIHTYIHRRELRAEERAEALRLDAAMAKLSLEAEQERIERAMKLVGATWTSILLTTYIHTYIHTYIGMYNL